MNQNRVNVVRLTNDEKRLIDYIRIVGQERLASEIRCILKDEKTPLFFTDIARILETNNFISMDRLIEDKFIDKTDADSLIDAINNDKSIIIIGQTGVGKTTLLEALLEYYKQRHIVILERYKSFRVSESVKRNNDIIIRERENLEINDITHFNDASGSHLFVFDETATSDYKLGLLTTLNLGSKVLATIHGNEYWKDNWVKMFSNNRVMKQYVTSTFDSSNAIFVYIGQDYQRKRKVLKITES